MTLGQRIKTLRKQAGLSQEKVAEFTGVSRQAVTKWENGKSAPSTENLFKLAELFGTTVDLLLPRTDIAAPPTGEGSGPAPERSFFPGWQAVLKKRTTAALAVGAAYLLLNLAGRLAGAALEDVSLSLMGLLLGRSVDQFTYLFGWLICRSLFAASAVISIAAALLGKYRLAAFSVFGFTVGLLAGELLGCHPAGAPFGQGHYGWLIWGGIFLLSLVMGGIGEHFAKRENALSSRRLPLLCAVFLAGALLIVLLVRLGIPTPTGH